MIGLSSRSLWTPKMRLKAARQATLQPFNPHQAVADCLSHPRDHSVICKRKHIQKSYYCTDGLCSFLLKCCQSLVFGCNYVEKVGKKGRVLGCGVAAESKIKANLWGHLNLMPRKSLHLNLFAAKLLWKCLASSDQKCVHLIFFSFILRACCNLSAVCWPKKPAHNQGVKC